MSKFYNITLNNKPILKDWSVSGNVHTGVDLSSENVYSYSDGVVLVVGKEDNHYCVTIQYDVFNLLRYNHLASVDVGAGQVVQGGSIIGKADGFVHFEWATREQNNSKWAVRIGCQTYWKQNPNDIPVPTPIPEVVITTATDVELSHGK